MFDTNYILWYNIIREIEQMKELFF